MSISLLLEVLNEQRGDFLQKVSALVSVYISDILCRKDLSRKFLFENTEAITLKEEPHDLSRFINLCGLEDDQQNLNGL